MRSIYIIEHYSAIKRNFAICSNTDGLGGQYAKWNKLEKDKYYLISHAAAAAKSLQSCPTLCDPIDGSPPGSPIPGILQTRTLEWVAISFSNAGKWKVKSEVAQSCPTLSDPMDCSLPGSSVHVESKQYNTLVNITKKKQIHRSREQTNGH